MAYCSKCGNQMEENAKFCPHCGEKKEGASAGEGRKFCKSCGANIDKNFTYCPHCHRMADVQGSAPVYQQPTYYQEEAPNGFAIAGFVCSFLFALLGLIFSAIGMKKANEGAKHKGLATAGFIISIVNMVLGFIISV